MSRAVLHRGLAHEIMKILDRVRYDRFTASELRPYLREKFEHLHAEDVRQALGSLVRKNKLRRMGLLNEGLFAKIPGVTYGEHYDRVEDDAKSGRVGSEDPT